MISPEEYMSSPVITCNVDDTVEHICDIMSKHNIGSIVVTQGDVPVGIVTERDIVRKAIAKHKDVDETTANDIMTKKLHTIESTGTMMEVASIMKDNTLRRIIVMDGDEIKGIITSRDVISLLVE